MSVTTLTGKPMGVVSREQEKENLKFAKGEMDI